MDFAISLFPIDRWPGLDDIVGAVQLAERLGFTSVGLAEHLITPAGSEVQRAGVCYPDNFALGAVLARETSTLRLMLSALIVPYRHPVLSAKSVATLDWVSGGRVDVTTGVGWLEPEFAALGVPMAERGRRTDDYLKAMIALWTQEQASYAGAFVSFEDVILAPTCVQRPHVPLLIGGNNPRALERVLELGVGWAPMLASPEVVRAGLRTLAELAERGGADVPDLRVFTRVPVLGGNDAVTRAAMHEVARRGGPVPAAVPVGASAQDAVAVTLDLVYSYREAGVTELGLAFPWSTPGEFAEKLEWFASAVMPEF